jgi:hypothetical protein
MRWGRAAAAKALGKVGGPAVVEVLGQAILAEKFWHVQGEMAQALGQIRTPRCRPVAPACPPRGGTSQSTPGPLVRLRRIS